MRAAVVDAYKPHSEIEVAHIPDPVPGPGEVVVDVEATEVNYPDILHVEGQYQVKFPFPFVPGLGGVGQVSAVGTGVDDLSIGDRVLALTENGTHAERVKVARQRCFAVPPDVPSDIAAALGLAYQTAWAALVARGRMRPGDRVLVLGATGGVGMAAVQLARAFGANQVIAGTRGDAGAALARKMGADVTIDTAASDINATLRDSVRAATSDHGVDVIIDPVGGELADAAIRAAAWDARYVVVGFASGDVPAFRANYLLVKNISVSGLQWTDYLARDLINVRAAQDTIFALWRTGRLDPHISQRLPLGRISEALAGLHNGSAKGKIILLPRITGN